jgi:hypothetical protein
VYTKGFYSQKNKIMISQSQVKKTTSTKYTVGRHHIKERVNKWVLAKYFKVLNARKKKNEDENKKWAFVLESSACLTIETILGDRNIKFSECNIVIPNPDKTTIEEIHKKYPEVCLFQTTSHIFLKPNSCGSNNQSSSKTEPTVKMQNEYIKKLMINKNWNGKFDFCWLDYCGTINSRSGRRRKEDISNLFLNDLLNPTSFILAITLSKRGSPIYYENEIIDSIISHVQSAARKSTYGNIYCIGVIKYVIKAKMMTIIFSNVSHSTVALVSPSPTSNIADPKTNLNDDAKSTTSNNAINNSEKKRKKYLIENIQFFNSWNLFQFDNRQNSKLFNAYIHVAKRLVNLIKLHKILEKNNKNGNRIFVLENKLLPITSQILTIKQESSMHSATASRDHNKQSNKIYVALSNPIKDKVVAECAYNSISTRSSSNNDKNSGIIPWRTKICNCRWQDLVMEKNCYDEANLLNNDSAENAYCVVWLSYDEVVRTGHSLQHCSTWPDIEYLFQKKNFATTGNLLGIHIKHSKVGYEYWKDIFIDWVIYGITSVGKKHGIQIKCVYGCKYASHSPHMCLIFSTNKYSSNSECNNIDINTFDVNSDTIISNNNNNDMIATLPKSFIEFTHWDTSRIKIPCNPAIQKKYHFVATNLIMQLVASDWITDSILLYEPGNFIIYPTLVENEKIKCQLKNLCLCPCNDYVQYNDTINRIIQPGSKNDDETVANNTFILNCKTVEELVNKTSTNGISYLQSMKCMVILVDGGWKRFEDDWLDLINCWLQSIFANFDGGSLNIKPMDKDSKQGYIFVLLITSNGKDDISGTCLHMLFEDFVNNNHGIEVQYLPKKTTKSESLIYDLWSFHFTRRFMPLRKMSSVGT